jgi:hypothetical protein
MTTYLETHKQQICDVPISNRSLNSFDVYTTQDIEIPPFTMCNLSCHYKPRSNSCTDKKATDNDSAKKSRTEESFEKHINRINSLRMENGLSYSEKRRLEHLICKSNIGYTYQNIISISY